MIKYLKDSVLLTVYLYGASLLSLLVSAIPIYITNALTYDEFTRMTVQVISMVLTMCAAMFILCRRTGYTKNKGINKFGTPEIIITVAATSILHFILALIFRFYVFLYIPVGYIGGLINGNVHVEAIASLAKENMPLMILSHIIMMIPISACMALGFSKGYAKRSAERKKTLANAK